MIKTIFVIAVTILFSWTNLYADHHHSEELKILSLIKTNNKNVLKHIEELEQSNIQVTEFEFSHDDHETFLELTYFNKDVPRKRLIDPATNKTIEDRKLNFFQTLISEAKKPADNRYKISKAFRHGEKVTGAIIIEGRLEDEDSFYYYSFKGIKDNKLVKIIVDPITLKTIRSVKDCSHHFE